MGDTRDNMKSTVKPTAAAPSDKASITAIMNAQAREKQIKFSVDTDGAIPNLIKSDPLRVKQILFNIIGNAFKFTQAGGTVEVRVKLSPKQSNPEEYCLQFYVKDSGRGIPAHQSPRLFQPFSQADESTTRRFGGTGLGLALAKRLAVALGGNIELQDSEVGKGSTFVIHLDVGSIKNLQMAEPNKKKTASAMFAT